MGTVGTRLEEFMKARFGSQRGALKKSAESLDVHPSALQKYYKDQMTPGNAMQSKLRALGCDIEWLMTGTIRKEELQHIDIALVKIPVFDYIKAGGKSMMLKEEPADYIYATKSTDQSRYGVRVKGDSMEPEIRDGEIVVASKNAHVKDGDICVVTFADGETCLRRVYFHDHSVTITSDNKNYPPRIHKKKEIEFIHKVVEKITKY